MDFVSHVIYVQNVKYIHTYKSACIIENTRINILQEHYKTGKCIMSTWIMNLFCYCYLLY